MRIRWRRPDPQTMVTLLTPPADIPEPISVLLADRDADTRTMYADVLRRSGIVLDEAADGREALVKALSRPHDVVITDTRLPGISGYELCELLRRDIATKGTVIIVVTGEAYASNVERARQAGADAVLVKPCLPDFLLAEVHRLRRRIVELRRQSQDLRMRSAIEVSRSRELQVRARDTHRRALSRLFSREDTTTPPQAPPELLCPDCDRALTYQRSHIGGVSERHREQWDYYQCTNDCGQFQYRQRTRKLRRLS
jgi:DNA-binding response OmpR family regulator